jgi:hypothetical protein
LGVELKLQEALAVATADFKERVKKIFDDMKTKTTTFIKDVNEEMQGFSVDLKAYAVPEIERI